MTRRILTDEEKYRKIMAKTDIFWSRVKREPCSWEQSPCWLWLGAVDIWGYGFINIKPTLMKSHRAAWMLTHGMITSDQHVLHRCDNPPCCNPTHLFLGDNDLNVADMVAKGRQSKGEKNSEAVRKGYRELLQRDPELYRQRVGAKLNEDQVRLIKKMDGTLREVASQFFVNEETIRKIRHGITWRHVT